MSSKRFTSPGKVALLALRAAKLPGVMILLLAIFLVGGGCATTSSEVQNHTPQMVTGEEEHHGLKLPDGVADVLSFLGGLASGLAPASW
jgi:hypothetical protein